MVNSKTGDYSVFQIDSQGLYWLTKDSVHHLYWRDTNLCYSRPSNLLWDVFVHNEPTWLGIKIYFLPLLVHKTRIIGETDSQWILHNHKNERRGSYWDRTTWVNKESLMLDSILVEFDPTGDGIRSFKKLKLNYVRRETFNVPVKEKELILKASRKPGLFDIIQ